MKYRCPSQIDLMKRLRGAPVRPRQVIQDKRSKRARYVCRRPVREEA